MYSTGNDPQIMEAEKSHNQPSASWRTKGLNDINPYPSPKTWELMNQRHKSRSPSKDSRTQASMSESRGKKINGIVISNRAQIFGPLFCVLFRSSKYWMRHTCIGEGDLE